MSRDVIMSIHPEWIWEIFAGKKTIEVRKRAPLQEVPFKVYIYCTKGKKLYLNVRTNSEPLTDVAFNVNNSVIGEFTCVRVWYVRPPFKGSEAGTCLTAKELYEYMGSNNHLDFIEIKNPTLYDIPKKLEDFGLSRPPQSWCYVKETIC